MSRIIVAVCVFILFFFVPVGSGARVVDHGGGYICNVGTTSSGGQTWEFWDCFYLEEDSGGGGGGYPPEPSPGGGGGGSYNVCRDILQRKPSDCLNEIATPSSAEYGYGSSGVSQYANGSGLPKLIVFKNSGITAAGVSTKLENLLKAHTQQLASGFVSRVNADTALTEGLQDICLEQNRLMPYPYSAGTEQCLKALNRLVQERNSATWLSGLSQWVGANNANFGFSIGSVGLDFQTLISLADPANSLEKKSKLIEGDVQCALWWQDARASGCVQ